MLCKPFMAAEGTEVAQQGFFRDLFSCIRDENAPPVRLTGNGAAGVQDVGAEDLFGTGILSAEHRWIQSGFLNRDVKEIDTPCGRGSVRHQGMEIRGCLQHQR